MRRDPIYPQPPFIMKAMIVGSKYLFLLHKEEAQNVVI